VIIISEVQEYFDGLKTPIYQRERGYRCCCGG